MMAGGMSSSSSGGSCSNDGSPAPAADSDAAPSGEHYVERTLQRVIEHAMEPLDWLSAEERAALKAELHYHLGVNGLSPFQHAVRVGQQHCMQWQHRPPLLECAQRLLAASMLRAFYTVDFEGERQQAWRRVGTQLSGVPLARSARTIIAARYEQRTDMALVMAAPTFKLSEVELLSVHAAALDAVYRNVAQLGGGG